jgi:DNA N-6-adenine-methyltransferase (Dam)
MALHEQCVGATDEWYTPPYIFKALDVRFDLDVSASPNASWVPADAFICADSLSTPWRGFVWMNPPFGGRNALTSWLEKFLQHGDGIALVPDRTSAPWFRGYAPFMDALLFVSPKIAFIGIDGRPGKSPAQGTCLMAKGSRGVQGLRNAKSANAGLLVVPEV